MYIPEKRTLRLVEIQESVLPEEEWLIGISDMAYFMGVGYSMPMSKDSAFFLDIDESGATVDDVLFEEIGGIEEDPLLTIDIRANGLDLTNGFAHDPLELFPSDIAPLIGLHLFNVDDSYLIETLGWEPEKSYLYAFLPGLFYCSNQATTVDGIAIQVTEKEMFGMSLSSFRPEDVRSFDVSSGIILDDEGQLKTVSMTTDALGKFDTDIVLGDSSSSFNIVDLPEAIKDPYVPEVQIACKLAESIPLSHLKEAYVSGSFLENRFMKLMQSIEKDKLSPRFRIYVRNQKYPNGKVVNMRYRCLDAILDLIDESGILCPDEFDLGMELQKLLFLKLAETNEEVDIERAVLDTYNLIQSRVGNLASTEQIIELLFKEGSSES